MKKRVLSLLLALALCLGLTAPAFADYGYFPTRDDPEWLAWKEAWIEANPALWAAFDPDLWFEQHYESFSGLEEYMAVGGLSSREELEENLASAWLEQIYSYDGQMPAAQAYAAAHPEEYAAFDPDAWVADFWYNDRAGYKTMWQVDDPLFEAQMWAEYVAHRGAEEERAARVAEYRAAHPGELEAVDVAGRMAAMGYREPVSAFVEDFDLSGPAAVESYVLCLYINDRDYLALMRATGEAYEARSPGSRAAFDPQEFFLQEYGYLDMNGTYTAYYTKEAFMAESSLLTEGEWEDYLFGQYALNYGWLDENGVWVDYDYGYGHDYYYNWYAPTLVVNGETVDTPLLTQDGVASAPAQVVNSLLGTRYTEETVPLRTAAGEAGWDVVWNQNQNQVVLLDREGLTAAMKEDFAPLDELMNRLLAAARPQEGQSYRTTETVKLALTAFHSIDGDQTYEATVKADLLQRDGVYDLTLTLGLADLLGLLNQATQEKLAAQAPKLTVRDLPALLSGVKLRVILDGEAGKVYWNAPILAAFDRSLTQDTWFSAALGEGFAGTLEGDWDTGALLYGLLLDESEHTWSAGSAYHSFQSLRETLSAIFGPDRFTRRGDTLTWSVDAAAVNGLMAGMTGAELPIFKEYDMSISVDGAGAFACQAALRLDLDALTAALPLPDAASAAALSWAVGLLDFRMAAQSQGTAERAAGTGEFHWKNQFKLEMEMTTARRPVDDLPAAAPPRSANVVEVSTSSPLSW